MKFLKYFHHIYKILKTIYHIKNYKYDRLLLNKTRQNVRLLRKCFSCLNKYKIVGKG